MPKTAKLYVCLILAIGALCLGLSVRNWQCSDTLRYAVFAGLAILAACFKVHLPGMRGTISISFVIVLVGVAELSFSETVITAAAAAIVQSVWRSKRRPQLVQVAFNAAVLAVSAGAACQAAHAAQARVGRNDLIVAMPVAAIVYFLLNTLMVSEVLALLQRQDLISLWKNCHLWSFPYYLAGAAIAAISSASGQQAGWPASFMVLGTMSLIYLFYRAYVERLVQTTAKG